VSDRSHTEIARSHHYYCRGCGTPLPTGRRYLFHPDCLTADERRRIQEKRRQEKERIWTWLKKYECTECQAKFRSQARISQEPSENPLCEVSQTPQSRDQANVRPAVRECPPTDGATRLSGRLRTPGSSVATRRP
jgi:hypothetical protein